MLCIAAPDTKAQQLNNYLPSDLGGYDVMPGVTVTSRFRPEYDSPGVRFGSLLLTPEASQSLGYDSNVLGSSSAQGSFLLNTRASLLGTTNWSRNNLQFDVDVDHYSYLDLPSQSYTNWSAGGGWGYEIGDDKLAIGVKHFDLNQLPSGIDSIGLTQPLPYHTDTVRLSYKAVRGPWTFVPLLDFAATRFDSNGTTQSPNSDRNVETASLTTFYEFAPQRSIVVVLRGTTAQYMEGQPHPNYNDISVLGGLDYDITGLLRFRALIGYESRSYQSAAFQDHSAPVVEGTLIWTPSGLTTVTATVTRRIEDANEAINTGYTYTMGRVVVDHEYLRNVLLQGRAWVENASYLQGTDQQTLYGVGASATFLLNRNLRLALSYDFTASQQDTGQSSSYTRNLVMLRLRFML